MAVKRQADKQLLSEIRSGDREACARIVRDHHAAVYRFLLHVTRDGHQAEELTQETFATAWERIGAFEGRCQLGTWLHRIAYNKFVDAKRRNGYAASAREKLQRQFSEPVQPEPMDALLADEQSRCLYQAVATLDESERLVIVLHYLQELSYREMTEVLAEPAGTVKWRTRQALDRLRRILSDEPSRSDRPQPESGDAQSQVVGDGAAPPA